MMPTPAVKLRVISLGAGVQSTTMALMAAHGEIEPMPDCAIFADTGAEPAGVYEHLRWIMSPNVLPFPVHIVSAGNIIDDLKRGMTTMGRQGRFAGAPFFIKKMKRNGVSFETAMGRRQCTRHYKLDVLQREHRRLLGYEKGARIPPKSIEVWIGISFDEAIRSRPARKKWQINRHPLLELMMTRQQCLEWLDHNGYRRPAKSACTFCPFRDDASWREMKLNDPDSFKQACDVDELVRKGGRMRQWRNDLFVHKSLKPLAEIDFADPMADQDDLFGNECEGMCGV